MESWTCQETRKKCNLASLDTTKSRYSPFNVRSKQCSVTIRSAEQRIQGGVKFVKRRDQAAVTKGFPYFPKSSPFIDLELTMLKYWGGTKCSENKKRSEESCRLRILYVEVAVGLSDDVNSLHCVGRGDFVRNLVEIQCQSFLAAVFVHDLNGNLARWQDAYWRFAHVCRPYMLLRPNLYALLENAWTFCMYFNVVSIRRFKNEKTCFVWERREKEIESQLKSEKKKQMRKLQLN